MCCRLEHHFFLQVRGVNVSLLQHEHFTFRSMNFRVYAFEKLAAYLRLGMKPFLTLYMSRFVQLQAKDLQF